MLVHCAWFAQLCSSLGPSELTYLRGTRILPAAHYQWATYSAPTSFPAPQEPRHTLPEAALCWAIKLASKLWWFLFQLRVFMAFGVQQGREWNLLFMLGMWFSNTCKFLSFIWFPLESWIALLFAASYFPCQILPLELWLKNTSFKRKVKKTLQYVKKLFIILPGFLLFLKKIIS